MPPPFRHHYLECDVRALSKREQVLVLLTQDLRRADSKPQGLLVDRRMQMHRIVAG